MAHADTVIGMGSAAFAAAVPYPGKATRISRKDNEDLKKKKNVVVVSRITSNSSNVHNMTNSIIEISEVGVAIAGEASNIGLVFTGVGKRLHTYFLTLTHYCVNLRVLAEEQ